MRKFILPIFIMSIQSAYPMQQNNGIKQAIDNAIANICTMSTHLTDVTDTLLLGDNLVNGKNHAPGIIRAVHTTTRKIQKGLAQVALLNQQLHDPKASRIHVGLLLIKKIEELAILIRNAI